MLKNVEIAGILAFVSMINTTSESLKARKVFFVSILVVRAVEISFSLELSFITSGAGR